MNHRIKLLVAYRHTLLRQALRTVLATQSDIEVVTEAADGKEAIEQAERLQPDVVLMDTQLPVVSGIEATQLIKRRSTASRGRTELIKYAIRKGLIDLEMDGPVGARESELAA